jgi:ribosomal protein S18 acetylase RimI-like enzyme
MVWAIRPLTDGDADRKRDSLTAEWGAPYIARRGEIVDALSLPGFVAHDDDAWLGLLTYQESTEGFEVVSIHVGHEGRGTGRALMDAALARAAELGHGRLWLSTTNENTRAIRFYQRWGMDLCAVLLDGVAASRLVKPMIPSHGHDGIPIRHELEFERLLPRQTVA